jgi:hypothetical protein
MFNLHNILPFIINKKFLQSPKKLMINEENTQKHILPTNMPSPPVEASSTGECVSGYFGESLFLQKSTILVAQRRVYSVLKVNL